MMLALLWTAMCIAPVSLFAQPDPPGGPVPLDGGVGLLIAAAAGMGVNKYLRKSKNQ